DKEWVSALALGGLRLPRPLLRQQIGRIAEHRDRSGEFFTEVGWNRQAADLTDCALAFRRSSGCLPGRSLRTGADVRHGASSGQGEPGNAHFYPAHRPASRPQRPGGPLACAAGEFRRPRPAAITAAAPSCPMTEATPPQSIFK